MDVYAINFVGVHGDDRPGNRFTADFVVKTVPLGRGAGFRVGQAVDSPIGMKDDRAGHHRSGQASPSYFVNARDRYEPVAVQAVFDVASCGDLRHYQAPVRTVRTLPPLTKSF